MCDKFGGTPAKFKPRVLDLVTAIGSVDQGLEGAMRDMLKARNKIEMVGTSFKNDETP